LETAEKPICLSTNLLVIITKEESHKNVNNDERDTNSVCFRTTIACEPFTLSINRKPYPRHGIWDESGNGIGEVAAWI